MQNILFQNNKLQLKKKYTLKKSLAKRKHDKLKKQLNSYKRLEAQRKKLQKQKDLKQTIENKSCEFLFQSVLFDYLEYKAPHLNENSYESRLSFANLISF